MGRKRYFSGWFCARFWGRPLLFDDRDALAGRPIVATVASLPGATQALSIGNQTFYYDGTNYYQPRNGRL